MVEEEPWKPMARLHSHARTVEAEDSSCGEALPKRHRLPPKEVLGLAGLGKKVVSLGKKAFRVFERGLV